MIGFKRKISKTDLRLISNGNITKCLNSTTTIDVNKNTTINDKNAPNPVEDYENLTNNETKTKENAIPHSSTTTEQKQINPFEVAQANKYVY